MGKYKYDNPDDAYKEAKRRIKKAKGGFFKAFETGLNLNKFGLTTVPPEIARLTKLRRLDLSDNQLTAIPPEIARLTNLTELKFNDNQLTAVPPEIARLTKLRWLYLYKNQLRAVPSEIAKLTNLTSLQLGGNQLRDIPSEITQLTNLTSLGLSNNQLRDTPTEITQLTNLTSLLLDGNQLRDIPSEITQLTNLTDLGLGDNQLTVVPLEITQLWELEKLYLNGNQLRDIPSEITQLWKLKYLNLSDNQLTAVPPELAQLTYLTWLELENNQLTEISPDITQLTTLISLELGSNQLTVFPPEIVRFYKLKWLRLSDNQLTAIPPEITQLTNLIGLDLRNNPDLPIPPEILEQIGNPQAIFDYLQALPQQPETQLEEADQQADVARPLNEAKLILVGQGGVGKTSLVKRLVADEFDLQEDQTKGIHIEQWQVDVPRPNQEKTAAVRLNIWDFGGQEIMHATHQFFLTKRSLYLLVLDARQEEGQGRLAYWLSLINSFAADAPVLIIINKIDQQALLIDQSGLQKKHPSIVGFVSVSAKSGQGMDDLKAAIITILSRMKHIDDLFPASWMRVKEALATMQGARNFLPYHEYQQLCQQHRIERESEQHTLIGFLHDLGIVLNFQDDDRVGDTSVLNPGWVTDGVYALLNSPLLQAQHGLLRRNQLSDILPAAEYPRTQHRFLLDMMLKFELAYETDAQHLLIPDLLAKEEPSFAWEDEGTLQFAYQYHILPRSILHRFMVRQYTLVDPVIRWRNGAVLHYDGLSALAKADIEAKTIRIAISGSGDRKQFLYSLRLAFAGIHESIAGIKPQEVVPIPGYPDAPPLPYSYLEKMEAINAPPSLFPGTEELMSAVQLLGNVTTADMRQSGLPPRPQIAAELKSLFNREEFYALLFDLDVDRDDLVGESVNMQKQDCVLHLERRGRLAELVAAMAGKRPFTNLR